MVRAMLFFGEVNMSGQPEILAPALHTLSTCVEFALHLDPNLSTLLPFRSLKNSFSIVYPFGSVRAFNRQDFYYIMSSIRTPVCSFQNCYNQVTINCSKCSDVPRIGHRTNDHDELEKDIGYCSEDHRQMDHNVHRDECERRSLHRNIIRRGLIINQLFHELTIKTYNLPIDHFEEVGGELHLWFSDEKGHPDTPSLFPQNMNYSQRQAAMYVDSCSHFPAMMAPAIAYLYQS